MSSPIDCGRCDRTPCLLTAVPPEFANEHGYEWLCDPCSQILAGVDLDFDPATDESVT